MRPIVEQRFRSNIGRIDKIITFLEMDSHGLFLGDVTAPPAGVIDDLARAAVVFLHAALEDLLRNLAEERLPAANADVLSLIPLVGSADRRKSSFDLGDLMAHRTKTVESVIEASVIAHLERASYNNPGEIKALLRAIDLPIALVEPYARDLAAMMNRRHLIAHRADRDDEGGPIDRFLRPISTADVIDWRDIVEEFVSEIFGSGSVWTQLAGMLGCN